MSCVNAHLLFTAASLTSGICMVAFDPVSLTHPHIGAAVTVVGLLLAGIMAIAESNDEPPSRTLLVAHALAVHARSAVAVIAHVNVVAASATLIHSAFLVYAVSAFDDLDYTERVRAAERNARAEDTLRLLWLLLAHAPAHAAPVHAARAA